MKFKKIFIGIFLTLSLVLVGITTVTKVYAAEEATQIGYNASGKYWHMVNVNQGDYVDLHSKNGEIKINGSNFAHGNHSGIMANGFTVILSMKAELGYEASNKYYKITDVNDGDILILNSTNGDIKINGSNFAHGNHSGIMANGFRLILTGEPTDNRTPVISGQTTFVADVDQEKPISHFMSFLSAYDETDGDVTDSLTVITDNYTANKRVLGNHTFIVQASDSSGNTATATINVRVVDIVAPVISGNASTVDIGYDQTYNIENFRKTLTVTDNYQTMTNSDIKVDADGYTSNKTKLGTYTITFQATDASSNKGTFSKKVRVIDNVAPTFSGPTIIATSNNTVLTESDIRAQLTANDFIDGNITNKITLVEDNYTGKGNKVGSYTIIYSVSDNAGNTNTHTVTIQRTDKIPPTIWVQDGVSIRTTPDTPINRDIIIDILEATGQIEINATTTFSFLLDEYSGNEETPGVYAMTLSARSTNGNESVHSFAIEVLDTTGSDEDLTREPGDFIKDNMTWLIVGGVALIGVVYFIRKRK